MPHATTIAPLGEAALLVQWRNAPPEAANRHAHALASALWADPPAGMISVIPALDSVLVRFEPLVVARAALQRHLEALLAAPLPPLPMAHEVVIEVEYGGAAGPDLAEVAQRVALPEAEVVRLHTSALQRVAMIGFAPGYPYLVGLPPALHLPRRTTPRSAVPAGSVAIAAGMTGIYPARLPGGWHLIGRTEAILFDPTRDPPALLAPGDYVRFVAKTSS